MKRYALKWDWREENSDMFPNETGEWVKIDDIEPAIKAVLEKKDEYDETMIEYSTDLDAGKKIEVSSARSILLCAIEDLRAAYGKDSRNVRESMLLYKCSGYECAGECSKD